MVRDFGVSFVLLVEQKYQHQAHSFFLFNSSPRYCPPVFHFVKSLIDARNENKCSLYYARESKTREEVILVHHSDTWFCKCSSRLFNGESELVTLTIRSVSGLGVIKLQNLVWGVCAYEIHQEDVQKRVVYLYVKEPSSASGLHLFCWAAREGQSL